MQSSSPEWKDFQIETWQLHVLAKIDEHHQLDGTLSSSDSIWFEQYDVLANLEQCVVPPN